MFAELNNWLIPSISVNIVLFLVIVLLLIYYRTEKRNRESVKTYVVASDSQVEQLLQSEMMEHDYTKKQLNEKIEYLEQYNYELLEEIDGLKNTNSYYKKRLKEKDKEIAESQSQVLTLRETLQKATQEIKDLGSQIHAKNNEILELRSGI